jgi:hypothetical protein
VLYGEVYGQVQDLKYGAKRNEVRFAAFDLLTPLGGFVHANECRELLDRWRVPQVPLLGVVAYDFGEICKLAEGQSMVVGAGHEREGCVIKPLAERYHQAIGRVTAKVVSAAFLERH